MTDDPPSGVSVLFFQVNLTAASLAPASGSAVSLLSNDTPIQVDVTQLQALSAFLSAADVPAGTYNSLSLTFASPQLVIYNASDESIASSCAVGSVCQLTPAIDNSATVALSTAPFPVTVAANSPLGFLVDFHLNTIIQSDLSVNLGAADGVTIKQLPGGSPSQPPRFGFLTGTVESVSASHNQFTLMTAWGRTFTVDSNSSTAYDDFPTSACSAENISCLSAGQVVQVQVSSVANGGVLMASQVTYVQAAGQQTVEGTIVGITAPTGSSANTVIQLILHRDPTNSSGLPRGGKASVTIASDATFSIDANGFTLPSGLAFAGTSSLSVGQNVKVNVAAGSLSAVSGSGNRMGWGPPRTLSFTTSNLQLEPSQLTGSVSDIGSSDFTLGGFPPICFLALSPIPATTLQADVETTSETTYRGFSTDSFSGIESGDVVSVNGWLFPPASGKTPTLAAQTIALHGDGIF
jgi:hypothetical protein